MALWNNSATLCSRPVTLIQKSLSSETTRVSGNADRSVHVASRVMVSSTRTVRDLHDGTPDAAEASARGRTRRRVGDGDEEEEGGNEGTSLGGAGCGGDADGDDLLPSGAGGCGSEAASMADWL
ncbi:hypothetical protein OsI_13011 [Oryza sativa Indica Group]|uniref:Uncharacterized protein n=1 Tax=Oryza sativa subsp. indica TaxID=39946 RepID=A2XKM9_ORYSI|nr:hypothetical protein OsI_13011 [Oryza sativa Indica Group]